MGCFTREFSTAEIGLGCLLPQDEKKEPVHVLVLNIVENFDPLWNLVKEFCDYLIIEDATSEEESFYRLRQFQIYKGSVNCSGIEGNNSVLVWKVSTQALETEYLEEENEFGFFGQILVRSHH